MSADIIDLFERKPMPVENRGNGGREALAGALADSGMDADLAHVDLLLSWLWYHGFMVAPVPQ